MRRGLVCVALATAACSFKADYPGTLNQCDADGACPDHYVCVDQRCAPTEPAAAECAIAMTAGDAHTCAIRTDGTAWCWGANDFGQLGDGTTLDRTSPVQVQGKRLPGFTAIAGGKAHSCALGADGTVWCWGHNDMGQLGDGSVTDSNVPVLVLAVSDARAIVAGDSHSCALRGDGSLTCWGNNLSGQLGNGRATSGETPVAAKISGVTAVAAGGDTTCTVDDHHALSCWGANSAGQFGDGSTTLQSIPTPLAVGVAGVAVGRGFSCALTTEGAVLCSGLNAQGQLGNLTGTASHTRVIVALRQAAVTLAAGDTFACATDGQARLWCWGENDGFEFADTTSDNHTAPVLTPYTNVKEIVGGGAHLCARSDADGITCSGYNGRGQLGDGRRTTQPTPRPVAALSGVTAIAGGGANMCVTLADKTVRCWGDNTSGQIGDGTRIGRTRPTPVESVTRASGVAVGGDHACAMLEGTTSVCWGANDHGQLGDGTNKPRASAGAVVDASGAELLGVMQLAVAEAHGCALGNNGVVSCWGQPFSGQGIDDLLTPVALMTLPPVQAIAVGARHGCGIDLGGVVECWGYNGDGELGTGGFRSGETPVPVVGLMDVSVDQVATQGDFTCAHASDGSVRCWGPATRGELGDNMPRGSALATSTFGLSGATQVAVGGNHGCARKADETIACWGANDFGQLGDGSYVERDAPAPIRLGHVRDIAAGDRHTCALLADGTVACWGDDSKGQLGDGIAATHSPVAPLLPCR